MNHNDFGGAVIPAMAGFLFWKRAKVQEVRQEPVQQLPALINEAARLTGVAKYISTLPLVTGVSKYLKKQEKSQISGVGKYILRQEIREKDAPVATGVAKYIANSTKQAGKRNKTTVDKYLFKREFDAKQHAGLTGVARYEAEQNLLEKKRAASAMVERYKAEEARTKELAKEMAQAAYASAVVTEPDVSEETAETGLGRYLQKQAKKAKNSAKPTGVARYIAKQIIIDSQKPALSSVSKYLRKQTLTAAEKPAVTGVAKYVAQLEQKPAPERKPSLPLSGVAKYLAQQDVIEGSKPVKSKVALYLEQQARPEQDKPHLALSHQEETKVLPIEGEFIPAGEVEKPLTGVARYLNQQVASAQAIADSTQALESANPVGSGLTGVARYLEKTALTATLTQTQQRGNPTGVDRYLLRRA